MFYEQKANIKENSTTNKTTPAIYAIMIPKVLGGLF